MARPGLVGGQYQPLTDAQIKQIHQASLSVLEHTGVHVEHEEALALYLEVNAARRERIDMARAALGSLDTKAAEELRASVSTLRSRWR